MTDDLVNATASLDHSDEPVPVVVVGCAERDRDGLAHTGVDREEAQSPALGRERTVEAPQRRRIDWSNFPDADWLRIHRIERIPDPAACSGADGLEVAGRSAPRRGPDDQP